MIELWTWSVVMQCHVVTAKAFNFEDEDMAVWYEVTQKMRGDDTLESLRNDYRCRA